MKRPLTKYDGRRDLARQVPCGEPAPANSSRSQSPGSTRKLLIIDKVQLSPTGFHWAVCDPLLASATLRLFGLTATLTDGPLSTRDSETSRCRKPTTWR